MKWVSTALLLFFLLPFAVRTAPSETRLMRQPDISKDAIVFVYAEDLWTVPRASLTSFSPDGQKVAYNPTSQEFRTWKRYRGGWTNYIGIYDLKRNSYEEIPRSGALDQFPMWRGNAVYFISDRDGTMNLYRYDLGSKQTKKLTNYTEYDIKWPSAGSDAIVYENGGLLYSYELASGKTTHVPVTISSDLTTARPEIKTVANAV